MLLIGVVKLISNTEAQWLLQLSKGTLKLNFSRREDIFDCPITLVCCATLLIAGIFSLSVLGIMDKEDILLGMEMGRLEIEPLKISKNRSNENPFINPLQKRNFPKITVLPKESKCACASQKKLKPGIYKKKHNKVLKEPVLSILRKCGNAIELETKNSQESTSENISDIERCDPLSLCTLVDNCNQLTISSSTNVQNVAINENGVNRWWKHNNVSSSQEHSEPKQQSSRSGSCSQQALNPPCDVTIDELASYFETLVHIPKKMSSMAEMMYI